MPWPKVIPGMFARRLAFIAAGAGLALAVPVVQLSRLTVSKGGELRAAAEANLVAERWEPTSRGRILDRHGRVLAADRPSFDVSVDYPVITGQWAFSQAARRARRLHSAIWRELTPSQREQRVQELVPQFQARLAAGWAELARLTGVSLEDLEERKSAVIADVSRQAATVWERQRQARERELSRGRELIVEAVGTESDRPIREQTTAHVLLSGIDDRTAFAIRSMMFDEAGALDFADEPRAALPGLHLVDGSTRDYPFDRVSVTLNRDNFPGPLSSETPLSVDVSGVAVHVVGWMRTRVFREDEQRRPRVRPDGSVDRGYYAVGDSIGAWGIEASAEDELRGLRGRITERLDTGDSTVIPREPGADVRLTLDAQLQARVQALLSEQAGLTVVQPWMRNKAAAPGEHLRGAVVVLDIDSSDILALVSTPTFTRQQLREQPETVFIDGPEAPLLNRAIAKPYPPGSIVKPLIYAAAVSEGLWDASRAVGCEGHLLPGQRNMFRCWVFKPPLSTTHNAVFGHPLSAAEALMVSCNIYFYQLGRALGPERIGRWYERFGVGSAAARPALGVGDQFAGAAGPMVAIADSDSDEITGDSLSRAPQPVRRGVTPGRGGLSLGESTLMGIGQGPVAWTPLHAADALATLARGGVRMLPRVRFDRPVVTDNLNLDPQAVAMALQGLQLAVADDRGTGHHITIGESGRREKVFNLSGVMLWGKSGTADSGERARDATGQVITDTAGNPVSVDHSWFAVLAGSQAEGRPRYVVVVLVENGGSGGRVAGPLANQVLHALRAEGYL
jgi:penicillin-binding protein 2